MKLLATCLVLAILQINRTSADLRQNKLPKATGSSEVSPTAEALRGSYSSSPLFPASFDARDHWPQCRSIGHVQDEGCCHSGYAIAPTSAMTDRSCIASNGTRNATFSAYLALSCCTDCASLEALPCSGGDPLKIWEFWVVDGVARGDCLPYTLESSCNVQGCSEKCRSGMSVTVADTVVKGGRVYKVSSNVADIQKEILEHGPVQTTIQMFEDLVAFVGSNVYKHSTGELLGQQHIKLIGWGHDDDSDQDYWIAINSFGEKWGDNGSFKIASGSDHLGVESNVIAGLPMF